MFSDIIIGMQSEHLPVKIKYKKPYFIQFCDTLAKYACINLPQPMQLYLKNLQYFI